LSISEAITRCFLAGSDIFSYTEVTLHAIIAWCRSSAMSRSRSRVDWLISEGMTCSGAAMLLITMEDTFPKMATVLSSFRAYFASPMPAIVAPYPLRPTNA
jgi:hypothetical protein